MISRSKDKDKVDIQVTRKGDVLKFGNVKLFHNEIFNIASRERVKEYYTWCSTINSRKQMVLQHMHRRFLNVQFSDKWALHRFSETTKRRIYHIKLNIFQLIFYVLTHVCSSSTFTIYYVSSLNAMCDLILCGLEKI